MSDRPVLFPIGGEMYSWLKESGRMNSVSWRILMQLRWQSFWFDRNSSLQRKLKPGSWNGDDPVLIMGLWRSGTTFMHELLAANPEFIWPATWQCMNPSSFIMQSPPLESLSVVRPMDDFTVNTFSPQEDEFALLALGVPSVYRGFFDPGRLGETAQWLQPDFWCKKSEGWIKKWREFLDGVYAGRKGRLLLKSPSHTFRIRALTGEFQKASYIWLVRDPAETLFSNRKMWLAMFRRYALREWDESALDEFLGMAFQYAGECLTHATAVLGKDQLVVDFDRFTKAPIETIEAICHRLTLGNWDIVKNSIITSDAANKQHSGDSYSGRLVNQRQLEVVENLGVIQSNAIASHGLFSNSGELLTT